MRGQILGYVSGRSLTYISQRLRLQQHMSDPRRAWDDVHEWHCALTRLLSLGELMVRTSVSISNTNRSELGTIHGWVNSNVFCPTPPRSLFRIGLIQMDFANGQQNLSHWFKGGDGEWECMSRYSMRPFDSVTV